MDEVITSSATDSGGELISRRAALTRVAMIMGGALSAPLVSGILAGCGRDRGSAYVFQTLTPDQDRFVTAVVDRIVPETNTPGAAAAKVNEFIDHMLTDWYSPEDRAALIDGLASIDERATHTLGSGFLRLEEEQQDELLRMLDSEAIEAMRGRRAEDPPFFYRIKELTLSGYYTSEIGMTDELQYWFIPERFDPCIPVEEVRPKFA